MKKNENYINFYEDLIEDIMKPSSILKRIKEGNKKDYDYLE